MRRERALKKGGGGGPHESFLPGDSIGWGPDLKIGEWWGHIDRPATSGTSHLAPRPVGARAHSSGGVMSRRSKIATPVQDRVSARSSQQKLGEQGTETQSVPHPRVQVSTGSCSCHDIMRARLQQHVECVVCA